MWCIENSNLVLGINIGHIWNNNGFPMLPGRNVFRFLGLDTQMTGTTPVIPPGKSSSCVVLSLFEKHDVHLNQPNERLTKMIQSLFWRFCFWREFCCDTKNWWITGRWGWQPPSIWPIPFSNSIAAIAKTVAFRSPVIVNPLIKRQSICKPSSFWVIYNDLTATSLEWWLVRGDSPKTTLFFYDQRIIMIYLWLFHILFASFLRWTEYMMTESSQFSMCLFSESRRCRDLHVALGGGLDGGWSGGQWLCHRFSSAAGPSDGAK